MTSSSFELGEPTIFLDSNPEKQGGRLYSWYSTIKDNLMISVTGQIPERIVYPIQPGQLRLMWYTADGKEGLKDYALLQHDLVRNRYDELLQANDDPTSDVKFSRVLIQGYSGQNPYFGSNAFVAAEEEYEAERRREADREKKRAPKGAVAPPSGTFAKDGVVASGVGGSIEAIIHGEEEKAAAKRKEEFGKLEFV